jgi:putative aminopeptidase FrvX
METASLLRELCEARGPSGYEAEVRGIVGRLFGENAHEVRIDPMGNLIALRRGEDEQEAAARSAPRPSLMLAGHLDEIALIVTRVEKGFLGIAQIGGFDPRVLFGQEVIVHGRRELSGLIVSVPPHFTDPSEREKPVPLEKLFVDTGLPPEEVASAVRVGDIVTLRARWNALAGGFASCKSLDDRASVAAVALCLEEISRRRHLWDVYAVGTVQEEGSGVGAVTSAYSIQPTIAIAIDVTFGMQPGLSATEAVKMDAGPSLALGPNFHPKIHDRLAAAARSLELPYQVETIPGSSGTDAWAIQVSRAGVPCALVGIPIRSMHTPVETVCLRDIERTARLLAEFICRLELSFAETLVTRDALAPEGQAAGPATTASTAATPPAAAPTAAGNQGS